MPVCVAGLLLGRAALAGTLSVPSHEPEVGKACPTLWFLPAKASTRYVQHGDTWSLAQNSSPDFCYLNVDIAPKAKEFGLFGFFFFFLFIF